MEILYHDDDRNSEERCSECMRSHFNRISRKGDPRGSNSKRLRCIESFGEDACRGNCLQCSSKHSTEDYNDIDGSCDESLKSGVGENGEERSCPLRLRIRLSYPFQEANVHSIGSPCSENDELNNRDRCLLRLGIRSSARNQDLPSLNTLNEPYEYTEVGQDNKGGANDVSGLSRGPERWHILERFEEGKREGSDHRNRPRSRNPNGINPSTIRAHDRVKIPGAQNSEGTGCARTEYSHIRRERSKVSLHRAGMQEKSGGLFITYDSRRKRTDPQLLDLYVSKSLIHGQGVFTRNSIHKGVIILEFFGEIVRESVSNVRERRYLDAGMQGFYVFSLVGRGRQADRFCLDSTRKGGLGRFINHCCLPNTEAEIRDRGIVIRTIRNVECGEEITLDYKMPEGRDKCWCGAENCLGVLGGLG